MAEFPYTTVPGKLSKLFDKIKEIGIPGKATTKWLESIGFKSKNDRSLLPVLRFIGFLDTSSCPTGLWKKYRGGEAKQILARGIREGYDELYSTYPDAHTRPREELEHFFSTRSSVGKQAIGKTVSTFQKLCELADFGTAKSQGEKAIEKESESGADSVELGKGASSSYKGLAININIQLTLPETVDEKVYDSFFSAMKRHLLQGEN